ncbi:MAG TPA: putative Ig domain-containing protein, partial [Terriglobales bacterium]|nr:putative Ig domain-containing protein [Terriglobales bacterium]
SGAVNSSYSATLAATGGTPPITWSISSGTLPTGLTLHSSTGVIDGTPTVADTSSFTVTATDAAQQTKSQALSIVVKPILSITTTTLPNGTVSSAYSATLLSDGGTAPITWTVTSGTLPQGLTLNGATGVISGTPTTEGTANFTITATDSSTPVQTASAALSITIVPAPLTITTTTLPDATLGSLYSTVLLTSGGTNPITWSVTAGSLPAWASLDPQTGTISGTPSGSPGVATFTVKATDSGNPVQTATQSLSITTLNGGVNNAELNGKYAFTMRGFDTGNSNFIVMAGSFSADGAGNITGGVMDVNSETGGPENLAISGGTYSVGADNRGMLTLSTQQGNSTYAISLGSISSGVASLGHIVSTDARILSGVLKKQDTTAFGLDKFNGFYAFGMNGQEHGGGYFASVGWLFPDGLGAFTGNVDANDAGTVNLTQSIAGTYAVADATNGRLTLTDTTDGTHMAMYVVSAREFMLVNIDASGSPLSIGTVLEQSGSFSNASMNGVSVMWLQGNTSPTTSEVQLGFFTANGSGNFTLSQDKNDGGTVTSGTQSGTYSISGTGRMTVSAGSGAPIIYLVSPNQGFLMGTDSNVEFGYFEPQLASTFTNASISGNYMFGDQPPELNGSNVKSGVVTADGNGAISGTVDSNKSGTFATSTLTDNYSVASNGRATLSESVLYLISPSKGFMIQVDSGTKPVVTTVEK